VSRPGARGPIEGGTSARPQRLTDTRTLYADPAAAAQQAVDKIAAARVWLLKEKPFFGVLARALQVEPTLKIPAFRLTPDDRLLANALVVLELRFPSLCARLAHLCLHAALGAHVRRGLREPLRWNLAHDLAVDPLLRAAGFNLGLVLPSAELPPGASAEEYFSRLPEGARPDDLFCDLTDPPPPPEAPPRGQFTRQDDGEGDDPGDQGGRDGPENDGKNRPDEPDPNDDDDDDGDDDDDEPDPLEARARELQWKMRLGAALEEEAASGGKTFGDRPAWIDELVRATIEPPPDFSAGLQRSIALLTRSDRSFLRPSRRLAALASLSDDGESWPEVMAMPGRRVVPAGRLSAVIDTSASIDAPTLARFLGTLAAVATAEGFDEIRLIQADAAITRDETVFAAELLFREVAMLGRGGTDFGPALRSLALEARRDRERITVVYLTDLDGAFPSAADIVPLDVLWVVPGEPSREPPFGRVLSIRPRAR
jgi:predicted metal-dependent peptidase